MLYGNKQTNTMLDESKLKDDLQNAIDRDEFELYYQPKVDSRTSEIVGMEALLRWHHPELGIITPDKFVSAAEKSGQIIEIGKWAILTVCAQIREWLDKGLDIVPAAVNISICQLSGEDLSEYIGGILRKMNLPAEYLEIEITQSIEMDMLSGVAKMLEKLKRLGVGITIDDFGTEYSWLNRIRQLPVDTVKLDKSIIDMADINTKDDEIVKTVIKLIRQMGLKTVAEGVETKRQVEFLSGEGCYVIQGFFYYKPMPACEAERLLKGRDYKKRIVKRNEETIGKIGTVSETDVSRYLDRCGIHHSNRGYRYLVSTIVLGFENPQILVKMGDLYCKTAVIYGTKGTNVERGIRYSIGAFNMTNKEFITKAVDTFRYADDCG